MATSYDTTVLSTKGQMILPKAIRDARHWKVGTRLIVEDRPDGVLVKAAPLFKPTTIEEVAGSLRYDGPALTIEEMNEAVLREASRQNPR